MKARRVDDDNVIESNCPTLEVAGPNVRFASIPKTADGWGPLADEFVRTIRPGNGALA